MLKRLLIFTFLVVWLSCGYASAQSVIATPTGAAVVTVSTAPIGVACKGSGTTALIQPNGADIRFTLFGETPSTSTSFLLLDGQFFIINAPATFLAVRASSADATMKVTCLQN